jgi:hypothetical protein
VGYDELKEFQGKRYSGMRIGRRHTWIYGDGVWRERKGTPDKWEFTFSAAKRRKGRAPEGSGAPVGTEYHWYILGHQYVRKLDANTYDTFMEGMKHKVAHKRAVAEKWSTGASRGKTERARMEVILEDAQARGDVPEDKEPEPPPWATMPPAEEAPRPKARVKARTPRIKAAG